MPFGMTVGFFLWGLAWGIACAVLGGYFGNRVALAFAQYPVFTWGGGVVVAATSILLLMLEWSLFRFPAPFGMFGGIFGFGGGFISSSILIKRHYAGLTQEQRAGFSVSPDSIRIPDEGLPSADDASMAEPPFDLPDGRGGDHDRN